MTTIPRASNAAWQDDGSNGAEPKPVVGLRRPLGDIHLNSSSNSNAEKTGGTLLPQSTKTIINKPKRHHQRSKTEPSPIKSYEAPPRPMPKSLSTRDTSDDSNYFQPFSPKQTVSLFRKRASLNHDPPFNDLLTLKLATPILENDSDDSETEELDESDNVQTRVESVLWNDQLTSTLCYTTKEVSKPKAIQRSKTEPTILDAPSSALDRSMDQLSLSNNKNSNSQAADDSLEYSSHSSQFCEEQLAGIFRSRNSGGDDEDDLLVLKLAHPVLNDSSDLENEAPLENAQSSGVDNLYWDNQLHDGRPLC